MGMVPSTPGGGYRKYERIVPDNDEAGSYRAQRYSRTRNNSFGQKMVDSTGSDSGSNKSFQRTFSSRVLASGPEGGTGRVRSSTSDASGRTLSSRNPWNKEADNAGYDVEYDVQQIGKITDHTDELTGAKYCDNPFMGMSRIRARTVHLEDERDFDSMMESSSPRVRRLSRTRSRTSEAESDYENHSDYRINVNQGDNGDDSPRVESPGDNLFYGVDAASPITPKGSRF